MATELETKLNRILQEKTTKITPNNIRQGVTIFDVTGTLDPSGGSTTILDVTDDSDISVSGTILVIDTSQQGGVE